MSKYIICDLLYTLQNPGIVTSVTPIPGPYDLFNLPMSGEEFNSITVDFTIPIMKRLTYKANLSHKETLILSSSFLIFKNGILIFEDTDYTIDNITNRITFITAPVSSDSIIITEIPNGPMWYIPLYDSLYEVTIVPGSSLGRIKINATDSKIEPGIQKLQITYNDNTGTERIHLYNIPFWDGEKFTSPDYKEDGDDLNDMKYYFINPIIDYIDDRGFYTIARNSDYNITEINRTYYDIDNTLHYEIFDITRDNEDFVNQIQQSKDGLTLETADFIRGLDYFNNICPPVSATVISGGDAVSYPASAAFDGNDTTYWKSSQSGASVSAAYIGYDFGVNNVKGITAMRWKINAVATTPDKISVQYSNDGTNWETSMDYIITTTPDTWILISLPVKIFARYWRIKANPLVVKGGAWEICSLEMTENLYNENKLSAPISGGSKGIPYHPMYYAFDNNVSTNIIDPTIYPVLVLHMNGINSSTTFTDSMSRHTLIPNGGAQLYTGDKHFGTASGKFLKANSSYIYATDSSDFYFNKDFTIHFWSNFDSSIAAPNYVYTFFYQQTDSNNYIKCDLNITRTETSGIPGQYHYTYKYEFYFVSSGTQYAYLSCSSTRVSPAGTWNHIAITRSGSNYYLFLNGILKNSITTGI